MTRSGLIEYLILSDVRTVGDDSSGRPTTWGELRGIISQNASKVGASPVEGPEMHDALERLDAGGHLSLDKWDTAAQCFRPYSDFGGDSALFFKGQFRMRLTPEGRSYLERLETDIAPAPSPKSQKIGF